jgi:beta-lactamase superfamily II metal-dependent hydrolase
VLGVVLIIAGIVFWKFVLPRWREQPPPPSGAELQVHVLDVGQGDAILIIAPEGKTVLVDAGDTGRGKVVLDALTRYNVKQIDLFIATHAHADHIGGADEVINSATVVRVLDSNVPPPARETPTPAAKAKTKAPARRGRDRTAELPTTKAYSDYLAAINGRGAQLVYAEPGQKFEIGGGALITVLGPTQPLFTKDQLRSGGNEPNANSVVVRLDYGQFSMLLTGDAEKQTEERLISRSADMLEAKVLKVGHHGSKYATSEEFIKRVKPKYAVISDSENNRYGHPSQDVLTRLKAAGVKVYRTDLHGEITLTTKGGEDDAKITTAKEVKTEADVWAGREAQKDDSAGRGFVAYGDYGPPPRQRKAEKK